MSGSLYPIVNNWYHYILFSALYKVSKFLSPPTRLSTYGQLRLFETKLNVAQYGDILLLICLFEQIH